MFPAQPMIPAVTLGSVLGPMAIIAAWVVAAGLIAVIARLIGTHRAETRHQPALSVRSIAPEPLPPAVTNRQTA